MAMDPVRGRQLDELNTVELAVAIFNQAKSELYVNMHYLDVSLSSLGFEAAWNSGCVATDAAVVFYDPEYLFLLYKQGRVLVNRTLLHMLLHCLFCHMYTRGGRKPRLWNLACDIAMEDIIDALPLKCVRVPPAPVRREFYLRLKRMLKRKDAGKKVERSAGEKAKEPVLTAERIYACLEQMALPEREIVRLESSFFVDSHAYWGEERRSPLVRQALWKDNRERMQTAMETGQKEESGEEGNLLDAIKTENKERYDYRQFLRKFAVLKEEQTVDVDSFDYGYYMYGLSLYGNMPLIEPLESREVFRVEDFVIAIDTSMSCSGELICRFLEETFDVLSESETYFRKIRLHIIECDDAVRSDILITEPEQLKSLMENFEVKGYGGTDFRPVFEHVETLRKTGELSGLRGLIYFTDGKGIYPVRPPVYDVAFVFIEDLFSDENVPAWAMKVVLKEEELMLSPGEPSPLS